MINHKGILVVGCYSQLEAINFSDYHKDKLEALGYYLIVIPADESYIKLLSVENVTETELKELLDQIKK